MRPTILVDMDGPLAHFDRHYWHTATAIGRGLNNYHDQTWDITSLDSQRKRFLSDHVTDKAVESMARTAVNSPGWFAALPPTPCAAESINELAEHADVWVCSKPLEANPTCRDEKAAWLVEHIGPGWDKRLILAPDKSMIRGDLLLDDAIKPGWVPFATWKPVVFDTPWNKPGTTHGADWCRFTWAEGVGILLSMVGS